MARVNSLSLVRYRANDYSVPTAFGHREVLVKGYVHEVATLEVHELDGRLSASPLADANCEVDCPLVEHGRNQLYGPHERGQSFMLFNLDGDLARTDPL
jgi:hypothetical protein